MNESNWMNDARIASIPKEKLHFLEKIFLESRKLSQKELMPFLMALAGRAKKEHISFTPSEFDLILTVIRERSSEKESEKIDQALKLFAKKGVSS